MKFKRNIAIVFACYYMLISVGLTLTVHFCGGKLASVSAITQVETYTTLTTPESCCVEEVETNQDCCNDAIIDLSEIKDDSLFSTFNLSQQFVGVITELPSVVFKTVEFKNKSALPNYTFQSNAPPLYKLYGTYILYA
jgi:hypothetical protein